MERAGSERRPGPRSRRRAEGQRRRDGRRLPRIRDGLACVCAFGPTVPSCNTRRRRRSRTGESRAGPGTVAHLATARTPHRRPAGPRGGGAGRGPSPGPRSHGISEAGTGPGVVIRTGPRRSGHAGRGARILPWGAGRGHRERRAVPVQFAGAGPLCACRPAPGPVLLHSGEAARRRLGSADGTGGIGGPAAAGWPLPGWPQTQACSSPLLLLSAGGSRPPVTAGWACSRPRHAPVLPVQEQTDRRDPGTRAGQATFALSCDLQPPHPPSITQMQAGRWAAIIGTPRPGCLGPCVCVRARVRVYVCVCARCATRLPGPGPGWPAELRPLQVNQPARVHAGPGLVRHAARNPACTQPASVIDSGCDRTTDAQLGGSLLTGSNLKDRHPVNHRLK